MPRYIDLKELKKRINENIKPETHEEKALIEWCKDECIRQAYCMPTADVVEVNAASEQIIRKKEAVRDYWINDVKRYRAAQGYADIETAVDNFLRGYGEAVEDMLAILGEERISRDGS